MDKCPLKNFAQKGSMISEIVNYNIRQWYFFNERVKCHCQGFLHKMDKQNPKETFLLVVQKEVKEKGYILKYMQLARLWTGKSACGKLLKGEISTVPESLQEQCRFTGQECKTHGPI